MIEAVQAASRGRGRAVTARIEGAPEALDRLRRTFANERRRAILHRDTDALDLRDLVRLAPGRPAASDVAMAGVVLHHGVTQDDIGIALSDEAPTRPIPPRYRLLRPGDAFAGPGNRRAYGLFVGGDAREGHLLRFFTRLDPPDTIPDARRLKGAADLYPQPVPAVVDRAETLPLGARPPEIHVPDIRRLPFRVTHGWRRDDTLDARYHEAGLDPADPDAWPALRAAFRDRALPPPDGWMGSRGISIRPPDLDEEPRAALGCAHAGRHNLRGHRPPALGRGVAQRRGARPPRPGRRGDPMNALGIPPRRPHLQAMPTDRIVLIVVAVIVAAGGTIWVGSVLAAATERPVALWLLALPALVLALLVRVILDRLKERGGYDRTPRQ